MAILEPGGMGWGAATVEEFEFPGQSPWAAKLGAAAPELVDLQGAGRAVLARFRLEIFEDDLSSAMGRSQWEAPLDARGVEVLLARGLRGIPLLSELLGLVEAEAVHCCSEADGWPAELRARCEAWILERQAPRGEASAKPRL